MGGRVKNQPRHAEQIRRDAALKAAALVKSGMSREDAEKETGAKRVSVNYALILLDHGTADQLQAVQSGAGLAGMAQEIRRKIPKQPRRKPIYAVSKIEVRELDMAVWERLKTGMDAIAALPRPSDVVDIVARNNMRTTAVDRLILATLDWVTEFSNVWTNRLTPPHRNDAEENN